MRRCAIAVHRKPRNQGRGRTRFAGYTPGWKKAIVTLKQGDKIVLT